MRLCMYVRVCVGVCVRVHVQYDALINIIHDNTELHTISFVIETGVNNAHSIL